MYLSRISALLTIALATSTLYATSFSKTTYQTGNLPSAVVSADINRDGRPDLISADGNSFITVLLGGAGGTFTISGNFSTTSKPVALAAGDFNHDGYPDVAVIEETAFEIFISEQNGSLLLVNTVPLAAFGRDIVAVDLNGDHIPDLAMTFCSAPTACTLETLLNNGSGKFTKAQTVTLGADFFKSLVAADFDRDSHDDLATASDKSVLIFHSNNNGTLTLRQTITSPDVRDVFILATGDIDAKNGPDLVFDSEPPCSPTDCIAPSVANVYLNNGSGTLVKNAVYTTNVDSAVEFKLVDITADNRLDLIIVAGALQENNGNVSWAHYAGNGTFSSFTTLAQMSDPADLIGGFLNLDSAHDLAVADRPTVNPTGTVVFLNTGDATICKPPSSANLAATLCSPSSSTTSRTFTVLAAGNSPIGVRRVELWVDGKKLYNSPDDRLKTTVTLSSGKHNLGIVAVDPFGSVAKINRSVSVP